MDLEVSFNYRLKMEIKEISGLYMKFLEDPRPYYIRFARAAIRDAAAGYEVWRRRGCPASRVAERKLRAAGICDNW